MWLVISLVGSIGVALWLSWCLRRTCQSDAALQQTINDAMHAYVDRVGVNAASTALATELVAQGELPYVTQLRESAQRIRYARWVYAGVLGVLLFLNSVVYLGTRHSPDEQGNASTIADSALPSTEETATATPWRVGTPCPETGGNRLNYDSRTTLWSCGRWVRMLNGPLHNRTTQFKDGDACFLWEGYVTQPLYHDFDPDHWLTRVVRNRLPGGSEALGVLCPEGTLFDATRRLPRP
jgi:hypothetical protein